MILGEVKARPKDIISFSLDYISKSKVQTSNPSSSPIPLDTPARPADLYLPGKYLRITMHTTKPPAENALVMILANKFDKEVDARPIWNY